MTKNYYYVPDRDANGPFMTYKIIEDATQHAIYEDVPYNVVKYDVKRLNSGAGFAGWTPEFMLAKIIH